jgi:hypothetical protein
MTRLTWDPLKNDFMVEPDGITLRQFYMLARHLSGVSITKLTLMAGLQHPSLSSIEKRTPSMKKHSNSVKAILAALEALGYTIEIKKDAKS